jgi:hypothetical protein
MLKKLLSTVLIATLIGQPALAASIQYRIPLKISVQPVTTPPPTSGDGVIDAGDNPIPPTLSLSPSALQFDITGGERLTRSSLLVNTSSAPATLSNIESSVDFAISDDCPKTLAAGASCIISVAPTSTAAPGAQHRAAILASGMASPAILQMSTTIRQSAEPAPRLRLGQELLNLGTALKPGETSHASTTLSNVGNAPAALGGLASRAGFTVSSDCPAVLAAGSSCTISASFSSYVPNSHNISLGLTSGATGDVTSLTLYASVQGDPALVPALSFEATSVIFDRLDVGASASKTVHLTNRGTAPAVLEPLSSTPNFGIESNCPSTLAVGATCAVSVTFHALAAGTYPAQLLVAQAQEKVQAQLFMQGSVTGTASSSAAQQLTVTPGELVFGNVPVGESVKLQAAITNKGSLAAGIKTVAVDVGADQFTQVNDCGTSLAMEATCSVSVTFKPTRAEPRAGRVAVTLSDGSQAVLSLAGTGQKATLVVGPTNVQFGAVVLPGTSSAKSLSLVNSGNIPLTGLSLANSDSRLRVDYGTCTDTLAANQSCSIALTFAPSVDGSLAGSLKVTSNNGGSAVVSLSGSAVRLTVSSDSISFPSTRVGTSAADQTIALSNGGQEPVSIGGISITGGVSLFGQSNDCGVTLLAGASCSIVVRYTPTGEGHHWGELGVVSNGTLVSRVALNGVGEVPKLSLSKSSISFPATNVGNTSSPVSLVVSNPTAETVTFSGMSVVAGTEVFGQSNDCDTSLAAGATCTVTIQMTPTTAAAFVGTWSAVSSLGTYSVSLGGQGTKPEPTFSDAPGGSTGNGADAPLTPSGAPVSDGFTHYAFTFLDTEVGTSSQVRNVRFSNKGNGPLGIQGIAILSGETDFNQSNNCGEVLAPGASCTISLLFTPTELNNRTGSVVLLSDTGNFSFDLSGKGIGAVGKWYLDNGTADFGDVAVGSSVQRSFTFQNTGAVAAKSLVTTVTGAGLSMTSNSCGTSVTPVTLLAGATCRVTLTYAPTASGTLTNAVLSTTGRLVNGPVDQALAGSSPPPAMAFDAAPSGDYGTITVGTTAMRTFVLKNTGKYPDTLAAAPALTSSGFAVTGGTCTSGLTLLSNGTCTVNVTASPSAPGDISSNVSVTSTKGASAQVAVKAKVIQSSYSISGNPGTTTAPVTDFGQLTAGNGTSLEKVFYLRDDSNIATVASSVVSLVGDSSFTITSLYAVTSSDAVTGWCSFNSTGSTAPCNSGAPARAIRVSVKFTPATAGVKRTTLHFEHNGSQRSSDIDLTGTGLFNAAGAWSMSTGSTVAPTSADTNFGVKTPGTVTSKTFIVRNVGTHGGESVGFTLTGDTSQFKIVSVYKNYYAYDATQSCNSGGVLAADKLSATPCRTDDVATAGNRYPNVVVTVQFTPTASGSYSVALNPTSDNGTVLPAPLTLTGGSQFNPTGVWSTATASTVALTAADTNFGTKTPGTPQNKVFIIRNVGTNGAESVGFTLAGDTSQFKIVSVYKDYYGYESTQNCNSGGVLATDKLSATPCRTDDVATPGNRYPNVAVTVQFNPTATGNYTATLTPTTDNGTVLPAAITLTGVGQFNPTGVWSTTTNSTTAPTSTYLAYGTKTTGTYADKVLVMRNVGTNGAQATGFTLSGDTNQFQIVSVVKAYPSSSNSDNRSCNAGGVVASDKLSATPCVGDDVAYPYNYNHVLVTVRFAPAAVGNFSVAVTPTTNNGTVLPGAVTLTGAGQFNPAGAWSTATNSTTAPTAAYLAYGAKATGTYVDKIFVVRSVGTHGAEAVGFTLSGDTSQFQIVSVAKAYPSMYNSDTRTCTSGGTVSADKLSSTPCLAEDNSYPYGYNHVLVTVRFAPKAAGTFNATLGTTTNNGTLLPGPLSITGVGQ